MRKTARPVVWEGAEAQSSAPDPINTTFSRLYKDRDDGQWKSTDSFGRDDLLVLAKVADAAHTWICAQAQEKESDPQD